MLSDTSTSSFRALMAQVTANNVDDAYRLFLGYLECEVADALRTLDEIGSAEPIGEGQ